MHSNDRMSKSSMVFCNTCSIFCVAKRFESGWQVLMSVVYIVHPIYSLTVTMKHPQVQINNEHCRKNQVKQTVYDNHLIVWWRLLLLSTKIYLFIYFVNSFLFRSLARSFASFRSTLTGWVCFMRVSFAICYNARCCMPFEIFMLKT